MTDKLRIEALTDTINSIKYNPFVPFLPMVKVMLFLYRAKGSRDTIDHQGHTYRLEDESDLSLSLLQAICIKYLHSNRQSHMWRMNLSGLYP